MCGAECLTKHTSEPRRFWRLGIILNNGNKGPRGRRSRKDRSRHSLSPLLVLEISE